MAIQFSDQVKNYFEKKSITQMRLQVDLIEEPCTQIYNPKLVPFTDSPKDSDILLGSHENVSFYALPEFISRFGQPSELVLSLKGLLKKKVILKNIEPIIKNVCKI